MKRSSNQTLFFTLILAVFIIVIGFYANSAPNNNQSNTSSSDPSIASSPETKSKIEDIRGNIIYVSKSSDETALYSVSANTSAKKVFTDKDENTKIKAIQGITSSGKALTVMAPQMQEFGGSLYLIYTDGSGKYDKLLDEFASTQAPVISPNAKKIAYILFNNAEADYGFSLYVMDSQGENKQKITSDSYGLKILSFDASSQKITYLKGNNTKQSTAYFYDLKSNEEKELFSFKEKIYSLDFADNNLVLSKGPTDENGINNSEAYQTDKDGKNIKRLTANDRHDDFCFLSPNEDATACLSIKYEGQIDLAKSGDIIIYLGDENKKVAEGNYILGWY